jgi:hypothetical protein
MPEAAVQRESKGPGRPAGSRNRRTEELWKWCEEQKHTDPAHYLSTVVNDEAAPRELRALAANYLLPYKYSKFGTTPPTRYIENALTLPRATTVEQANENISRISEMKALGQIDLDFADSLISDNRTIANNLIAEEELKLKYAGSPLASKEQTIRIEGGLPPLRGTNVIMPEVNGAYGQHSTLNGHSAPVIDHQPAADAPGAQGPPPTEQTDGS